MKVSIIIPTYNVEAYITECLESVAQQTYQGEMECLIVDDCGTDRSIALAEIFIRSYQGGIIFKIIHHEHNKGLSAARNTGVEKAVGDYVFFLDSDDAILPETIEEMVKVVREHPLVEMVQGGMASMKGLTLDDFTSKELPAYTDNAEWIVRNMLLSLPISSCNRLIKREFLTNNIITFHEGIIHEDVLYNFLLAIKCRRVGFVSKNTYLFRPQRDGSITNTPQEVRALQSRIIIMNDCIDTYLLHHFDSKEIQTVVLKALWEKWMYYMVIHNKETLSRLELAVSDILKRMSSITPFPQKIVVACYRLLPIRLRANGRIIKIISCLI